MYDDKDMKIAGNQPSNTDRNKLETSYATEEFNREKQKGNIEKARRLGSEVAEQLCSAVKTLLPDIVGDDKSDYNTQCQQLLTFTVSIGFGCFCSSSVVARAAYSSFSETLKSIDPDMHNSSKDMGAWSFYFLAYRRGGDVGRRIGQTFAMLCSHDGDAVFQEMGEALYCRIMALVESKVKEIEFD